MKKSVTRPLDWNQELPTPTNLSRLNPIADRDTFVSPISEPGGFALKACNKNSLETFALKIMGQCWKIHQTLSVELMLLALTLFFFTTSWLCWTSIERFWDQWFLCVISLWVYYNFAVLKKTLHSLCRLSMIWVWFVVWLLQIFYFRFSNIIYIYMTWSVFTIL